MGNNVSSAFNYVFGENKKFYIRRNTEELCELVENNIKYSKTIHDSKGLCVFMFYDTLYSKNTIEESISILKEKGIKLKHCPEYPNKGWAETVMVATTYDSYGII